LPQEYEILKCEIMNGLESLRPQGTYVTVLFTYGTFIEYKLDGYHCGSGVSK